MTDRVLGQRDLKDVEARLQAILDNVLDGIITMDAGGTIAFVNLAAVQIFGYEVGDVVGRNLKMLMPDPQPEPSSRGGMLARFQPLAPAGTIDMGRELEGLSSSGRVFPLELRVTIFRFVANACSSGWSGTSPSASSRSRRCAGPRTRCTGREGSHVSAVGN